MPDFLPQSKEYKSLGDLFEQWSNDIFLYFADNIKKQGVVPELEQHQRHLQFDMASNDDSEDAVRPVSLYYNPHLEDTYSMAGLQIISSSAPKARVNQLIAEAKRGFKSLDLASKDVGAPVISVRRVDLDGNETQHSVSELHFSSAGNGIDNIDPQYIHFAATHFYKIGLFTNPGYEPVSVSVLSERMEESLKYLSRLPQGVYVDVAKSGHSTTFRKLENGNISFYDCNGQTKESEIADYSTLHTTILKKNGHDDYMSFMEGPYFTWDKERYNTFVPHVYYLNNPETRKRMESFSLFEEDEFPHSIEDVNAFHQASPGKYTHLHWAVMMRDRNAVKRLLDTGMFLPDAKDACGRTALDIAVSNGNIDVALDILNDPKVANTEISANWFSNAFKMGHKNGFEALLEHPKVSVNIAHVAAAAMQNRCLDLVTYLLHEKKINPDSFIQSALLAYDLPLIDKLVSFGANVNVKDNKGNTALHHAYWLLDETMCGFVLKHQGNSLTEKNNDGESPLDILLLQAKENPANQKKVQDIIRQMVDSVDFKADQQNDKNSIFRLLKFAEEINDKELFHLLLEKAELTAEAFNQEKLDTENSGKPEEPVLPSSQEFVSNAKPLSSESTKEVHTTDIEPGIIASESSTPPSTDSVKDTSLSSESIKNTSPEPEVVVSEQSTPSSSREELDKLIIKATKEVSEFHALLNSNHNNYLHQAPVLALGENLCEITELLNSPTNTLDDEALWVSIAISALEQCFDGFNSDVQKIDTTPVVKNIFERFVDKLLGLFGFTNKKEQQKQEQVNFFAQNNPATVLREELASIKKSIAGTSTGKEAQCASVRFGDELAKIKAQADEKTGNELGQEPGQESEQTQILKRS